MKKSDPAPGGEEKADRIVRQVWDLTEPVIRAEGMEIIEIEYRRESPGWVLRMFVDQEGGVSVDDCARVSRVVGDFLDVADIIHYPYHLEVSSPGLNRPLRKREQFAKVVGKVIEVKTLVPFGTRRNFKGILKEVGVEQIRMDCDNQLFEIPFSSMDRARLRYFDSQED